MSDSSEVPHSAPASDTVRDDRSPRYRARGLVRHFAGLATADAVAGLGVAMQRDVPLRFSRMRDTATDYRTQRRGRSRPRIRALTVAPGARVGWRDVAGPPPVSPHGAIVHPIAIATCDLDRPMGLGRTPIPLPVHFGHECVAEVIEIGDSVTHLRPGDRVVVPFQINCGQCTACRAGFTAHCTSVPPLSMFGFGITGGQWGGAISDLMTIPYADAMLTPLPPGVDPAAVASVADNVAGAYSVVAPHIDRVLAENGNARVLIMAELGRRLPFGISTPLYAGLIAFALGVTEVHFFDRNRAHREHAERLGMCAHPPSELGELPLAPLVIDATGTPAGLRTSITRTCPGGVCHGIGSLHHRSSIPSALMYYRDVSLSIGMPSVRTVIPAVLDLVADGTLCPELVTTDIDRIDNAPNAIRRYLHQDSIKLVLAE